MDEEFLQLRPALFGVAYRMLGSVADAEDVVQEAYLRWSAEERTDVESPKAFLTTIVTRLSIDRLRSAAARRETYVGPWLPEPLVTEPGADERAEASDSISMAFLVLLESLNPVERAVFLLHDVFGYGHREIAGIVGRTEQSCRQIALRARKQIEARRPRFDPDPARRRELTARFLAACVEGDVGGLVALLAEDAVVYSDGGGVGRAARRPVEGAEKAARFLIGVTRKDPPAKALVELAEVNGQPGIVLFDDGRPHTVLTVDVDGEGIRAVHVVTNPEKLAHIGPASPPDRA